MKITDEIKEQINELYCQIKIKKKVAEIIGCSPSTVSKYIIDGYIPKQERIKETFNKPVPGTQELKEKLLADTPFSDICVLSDKEWEELKALQKEIFI